MAAPTRGLDRQLRRYLFTSGPIQEVGAAPMAGLAPKSSPANGLSIGGLRAAENVK
jgi:hypothetical protein